MKFFRVFLKMKKHLSFSLVFLIALTLILFACSKESEKKGKNIPSLKVYTSLFAFENFVKNLLPDAEVESLIPAGVDPHHFEPSLKDIQKLYSANMIIYLGDTDVDRWIDKVKDELTKKGIRVIRLQDSLSMKSYISSKELDPHVWLDPLLSIEILRLMKNNAIVLLPERKDFIEKNFSNYEEKLKEIDRAYRENLSNCAIKDVISTHEFLNYLSERYNFNSHFIVHEPEDEPSPKKVKKLKELIRKNRIDYILTEPEGEKIAETLSQETGVKPLNFNTYHRKTEKDYISVMKDNLKALSTALKCETKNAK